MVEVVMYGIELLMVGQPRWLLSILVPEMKVSHRGEGLTDIRGEPDHFASVLPF